MCIVKNGRLSILYFCCRCMANTDNKYVPIVEQYSSRGNEWDWEKERKKNEEKQKEWSKTTTTFRPLSDSIRKYTEHLQLRLWFIDQIKCLYLLFPNTFHNATNKTLSRSKHKHSQPRKSDKYGCCLHFFFTSYVFPNAYLTFR